MSQLEVDKIIPQSGTTLTIGDSGDTITFGTGTTPQLGGDLATNGNNINFGDNDKAVFGAGSDLQIYHDGSHSFINESGTGNLRILAQNFTVRNPADNESMIIATPDGGVFLYHDNAEKLATTSTGIDVTGTVVSDGLTVDTNTLYVDSANNRVGIGTSSPTSNLMVIGDTNLTLSGAGTKEILKLNNSNTDAGTQAIKLSFNSSGVTKGSIISAVYGDGYMAFQTNNDTEKMRISASGNVGIGTSSPSGKLDVVGDIYWGSQGNGRIFSDSNWGCILQADRVSPGVAEFNFSNASGTERMRIDSSGNLCVNRTSALDGGKISISYPAATNRGICIGTDITSTTAHLRFVNPNGAVGEILTSGSSTTYATSSDHRLKENVVDISNATERLKQLSPKRFNFIADADTTVDGFLAHEVSDIVPEAITGTHNEVEVWKEGEELPEGVSVGDNKLDDEGNTIPVYQGIDQSKLVPLLVASLKEALTEIDNLKARVDTLEGN